MIEDLVIAAGIITIYALCTLAVYVSFIYGLYFTIKKTRSLAVIAKRMWNFYESLPNRKRLYPGYPYVMCVFEWSTGKIVKYESLTADLENEEEVKKQWDDLKWRLAKKKEDE